MKENKSLKLKKININTFYFGDNLLLLKNMERDYINKIKCIYIDPPFAKNYNFITKEGEVAYKDKLVGNDFFNVSKRKIDNFKRVIV